MNKEKYDVELLENKINDYWYDQYINLRIIYLELCKELEELKKS